MSVIESKFNEWRVLLEKYKNEPILERILWKMGDVISQADHALTLDKVFKDLEAKVRAGEVSFAPKPFDVDRLIQECDGIMVDGFVANFVDTDDPETMVVVVEKGLWYTFQKSVVSRISLGNLENKIKDLDGAERTVMFYKRVPVEREDLR